MSHTCWYRNAWEGIWRAADEDEDATLYDLALRAKVYWLCDCGTHNPSSTNKCLGCEAKP